MFGDYSEMQRVLHNSFDIVTHQKTFKNYLEVVIDSEGVVHYAVPSHQEFLINYLILTKYGTREALNAAVPREYWFDMLTWLCDECKMICVWNNGYRGILNESQRMSLSVLREEGLYTGEI